MNVLNIFKEAIAQYPKLKGLFGVLAAICLIVITRSFEVSADYAVIGVVIVFFLFVLVVLAVGVSQLPKERIANPLIAMIWSVLVLAIACCVLVFTGYFFNWPKPIRTGAESRHIRETMGYIPASAMSPMKTEFPLEGKISIFGGPDDESVNDNEGLALVEKSEINERYSDVFLGEGDTGFPGLAKRLNTEKFYVACRWDYSVTPRSFLRTANIWIMNPETGKSALAIPVDYGPHPSTGRDIDMSPGLAMHLGLRVDDKAVAFFEF